MKEGEKRGTPIISRYLHRFGHAADISIVTSQWPAEYSGKTSDRYLSVASSSACPAVTPIGKPALYSQWPYVTWLKTIKSISTIYPRV